MPRMPIIMPQLGESIAEATIINFLVKPGDTVEADQDLIEVETNKASHDRHVARAAAALKNSPRN